jgi:uncharacterized protein YsxB (DUF464 family)
MIHVRIERSKATGAILSFQVKGHAGYANPGEDIVCASVSAITVGTVNSIEKLTGVVADARIHRGFLSARYASEQEGTEPSPAAKVQLLLESMTIMLQEIAESYGDYIEVSIHSS